MRSLPAWIALLLLLLAQASPVRAEIYEWTDAQGQLHFTQDLSQVPASQQGQAEERARSRLGRSKVQRIETPLPPTPRRQSPPARLDTGSKETHRVPFHSAAGAMVVPTRLNDLVTAPFIIDTGASDVVIPEQLAEQLGIRVDGGTPREIYGTANGNVRVPVVTLESVEIGDARVENVRAAIMPRLDTGLLGLSFFDHFTYHVDRDRAFIVLERSGVDGRGSEAHWRRRFARLQGRIRSVEARMARLTPAHTRLLRDLEEQKAALESQLRSLDAEADHASIPHRWRQ